MLAAGGGRGHVFISSVSLLSFSFSLSRLHVYSISPLSLMPLFSLSLGDDTKWSTRVDVSFFNNTNWSESIMSAQAWRYVFWCGSFYLGSMQAFKEALLSLLFRTFFLYSQFSLLFFLKISLLFSQKMFEVTKNCNFFSGLTLLTWSMLLLFWNIYFGISFPW